MWRILNYIFNKIICYNFFYGNCQLLIGLYSYFDNIKELFEIYKWQSYSYIREKQKINYNLLKDIDIFIYQPINLTYKEYSSDELIKYLNNNCLKIGIPFIYIDSFFPLIKKSIHGIDGGNILNDYKIINEEVILNLKKNFNNEQIIELYNKNKIYFNYEERFNENILRMREKEKNTDIKIVDFILDNYKNNKIMYMHHHPSKLIFDEIAKHVFKILKIDNDINKNIWNGLLSNEIYPYHISSIEHFNFNIDIDKNATKYYLSLINEILHNN